MYNPLTIAPDGGRLSTKNGIAEPGCASINTIGVPILRAQGYYPVTGKLIAKILWGRLWRQALNR